MAFADDELSEDLFLGGRLRLFQPRRGYRAATDPVLLAAAVPAKAGQSVLDLGCGAAAAVLCLGLRVGGLDLQGVEVQPDYAELARRNAVVNGVGLSVTEADLGELPAALRTRQFDHVMANPPFHDRGAPASPDPGRARARTEATPLRDWIVTGLARLRAGGTLTLIHRSERLPAILAAFDGRAGVTVLPLCARVDRPARRVIVQARKSGRQPFRLMFPLVLHDGASHVADRPDFSKAATAILRDMAALNLA